jgi:hypothetical protein
MHFAAKRLSAAACLLLLASCATAPTTAQKPAALAAPASLAPTAIPASVATTGLPDSFAGAWFVSGVYPSGSSQGSGGDRHIGVAVHISQSEVSDVNGQRCLHPDFAADQVSANAAGLKMTVTGDVARLQVTCDGKPFAILLQAPGKALPSTAGAAGTALLEGAEPVLLAQRPEAVYLLERAEQVLYRQAAITTPASAPASVEPEEPAAAPADEAKYVDPKASEHVLVAPSDTAPLAAEPAKPVTKSKAKPTAASSSEPKMKSMAATADAGANAAKKAGQKAEAKTVKVAEKAGLAKATSVAPKPGTAIHLASYNAVPAAAHGWQLLQGEYGELASLKPLYVSVDIAGKAMIRLFATGASEAKLKQICGALQAKQAYCALHP